MDEGEEGQDAITIDGSFGEGGGQIIRNAASLACILRKHVKIINIRANRPNPGLASQHLESIKALNQISGSTTSVQLRKGLTEFELNGKTASTADKDKDQEGLNTTIDLVTAGSVSLCLQCLLPYLFTLSLPAHVRVIGGTHVMKSPNFDYLNLVFIPILTKLIGYDFGVKLVRPGYFPRGGGSIQLHLDQPFGGRMGFKHFNLLERGRLISSSAILNLTTDLQKQSSSKSFLSSIKSIPPNSIETRNVPYASIEYFLHFEHSHVGFYHLVDGRKPTAEQLTAGITKVETDYVNFMQSAACLDEFMQDQLIIYMALAKLSHPQGSSSLSANQPTDHTTSAVHVAEIMTGVKFHVTGQENTANTFVISI